MLTQEQFRNELSKLGYFRLLQKVFGNIFPRLGSHLNLVAARCAAY